VLRAGGLADRVVAFAADLLPLYATAYAFEQSIFAERMSAEESERYLAEMDAYWKALPAERFPHIAALSGELMAEPDPDARFEFGLEVLVAGIAAMRSG
jgi:hypothetical protein